MSSLVALNVALLCTRSNRPSPFSRSQGLAYTQKDLQRNQILTLVNPHKGIATRQIQRNIMTKKSQTALNKWLA